MIGSEDSKKAKAPDESEAQTGTENAEGKQSGDAAKLEEVPIAEPVTETEPLPEAEAEAKKVEANEGGKKKEDKNEQPEQEPSDVEKKEGNPAMNPVSAATGEGDLEKGNEGAVEEKKQEEASKTAQTDPTFAELQASAVELLHKHGGWAWFVMFASFILLIQSAVVLSETRFFFVTEAKFAVAYAVITMCSTFTFAMVMKFKGVPEKPRQLFIVILLLWVIIGTGIITFRGPFFVLSNGYFAAWATVFGTYWMFKHEAMNASQYVEEFRANAGYLTTLFVTSLIQFFSAVAACSGAACDGLTIYAVVVGVVSALACIVLALATSPGGMERKVTYSFLLLWWFAAICALTFSLQSRFAIAGNGYFSLWASFLVAGILTFLEFREKPGLPA